MALDFCPGSKTSAHHLDPRITRRISRNETTVRGDPPGETHESSDSADAAVLMELASYMRRMSLRKVVGWAPREGNKEADKLANGNAEDFDPSLRIDVSASTLSCDILPEALEAGGG